MPPIILELKKDYETEYLCGQLDWVRGRRYNIRPDLDEDMEPEVKGYLYKETTTGFFRAWVLNELHLGVTKTVNELRVAEKGQIIQKTGLPEEECLHLIEKCVVMGLLCENKVVFKNGENILLYLVDTGGIFALEEAGIPYLKVNYTVGIDQRLKIYRRNIFLVENNVSEAVNLHFYENIVGLPLDRNYRGATILVDMRIAEKLGLKSQVIKMAGSMVEVYHVKIYDLCGRRWIEPTVEKNNTVEKNI
ncbi:MAG: hypothetical protein VR68_00670 [Peptococcaceae bacterium BRH_c4a]|nr:MAG: hypothetical protein VR68_00670 [Peptococcaceae bacterium BRH_c4a]